MIALKFKFRWAIRQVDDTTVQLVVRPGMTPILHQDWITEQKLTDAEVDAAESAVVEKLAGPEVVK